MKWKIWWQSVRMHGGATFIAKSKKAAKRQFYKAKKKQEFPPTANVIHAYTIKK